MKGYSTSGSWKEISTKSGPEPSLQSRRPLTAPPTQRDKVTVRLVDFKQPPFKYHLKNSSNIFFHCKHTLIMPYFIATAEKVNSESKSNEKLKREGSLAEANMAPSERLRPLGASAEEEVCESGGNCSTDTSRGESSGERPVHIIIKPQGEEGTERKDSQEPSQCLPPIM